jgi:hypothetical protein
MTPTLEDVAYRLLPRVDPGRALANVEWRTLVEVAEVLQVGSPVAIQAEQIADNVETFLIVGSSRKTWRVRILLTLINGITLSTHGRTFHQLTKRERSELVQSKFTTGRHVWGLCAKVRYLVTMGIYGDDRAIPATGYVPVHERQRFMKARRQGQLLQLRLNPQLTQEASHA